MTHYRCTILLAYGLTLALSAAGPAAAAATPALYTSHPDMSLAGATRLIDAAMGSCHAQGKVLAAAVVDRGGNLVALQRDDSVGPHNVLAAQRKAYTALSTKSATRELANGARANPDANNLNTVGELLLLGGGVPVRVDGEVIGALGVAGAGGAAADETCALEAIARVFPVHLN